MTLSPQRIYRFAPSPTGLLHKGHAYSAILGERMARASGGRYLLRIEDIDHTRCRPHFTEAIYRDLDWLGIGFDDVSIQSAHLDRFRHALDRLGNMGLLYPCYCTRAEIKAVVGSQPHQAEGPLGILYPGTCRGISDNEIARHETNGRTPQMRLNLTAALKKAPQPGIWTDARMGQQPIDWEAIGDVVLARKDIGTSYHLAVVTDDGSDGVTDIVRGEDLLEATPLHFLLFDLLGYQKPLTYHHALVRNEEGDRLAKLKNSPSLESLRTTGVSARALRDEIEALIDLGE